MQDTNRYVVLDGLRGVAALCIVVLHSDRFFGDFALPSAALAVDLFFCLSGFVLAHAYDGRLDRGITPGAFMRMRIIRLYPLFLVGILLGVAYYVAAAAFPQYEKDFSLIDVAISFPFNALMLPSPVSGAWYPFNGVMWSIFFELVANLLWVTFYRPLKSTSILIAVIAVAAVAFVGFSYLTGTAQQGVEKATFLGGVARVSFSFFLGVLIFRLHRQIVMPRLPDILLIGTAVAVFALPRYLPLELFSALVLLPLLVALGAVSAPNRALSQAWSLLGEASYAVYCIHKRGYVLLYAALLQFVGLDAQAYAPISGAVYLLLVFGAGLMLTRWLDLPARHVLTSLGRPAIRRS